MDSMDLKKKEELPLEDSGTESYTESPINDEESELSEDSTICDSESFKSKKLQHLLEKSFSVDENLLDTPLIPEVVSVYGINKAKKGDTEEPLLNSILRRGSCFENKSNTSLDSFQSTGSLRRVSFPSNECDLASYMDPDIIKPFELNNYSSEEVLEVYEKSCKIHQTIELDSIKSQIAEIKDNLNHSATLSLSSIKLTYEVNETLEDLLKVTNFRKVVLSDCKFTAETITEFFNMLEYYESIRELELAVNFENTDAWQSLCNLCCNLELLEVISFKEMTINEEYMRKLLHAVKSNPNLTVLRFDGCTLDKLPSFYLLDSLKTNRTLRELYLPSSGLYNKEATSLGFFLQNNTHLKVLDISNNFIGDRGLEALTKGLIQQNEPESGLSVLVVVNNQLTEKCGSSLNNILNFCLNLHTLNVGYNNLTDTVLSDIKTGLTSTKSLEGLGLQCTLLTCKGMESLAKAIENNDSLLKINLKGNKAIQVQGLERLCTALTNSKIIKIEIDEFNRSCGDPSAYAQMVKKLNAICTVNKSFQNDPNEEEVSNISRLIARKMSLSCEPRFITPEITSQISLSTKAAPCPLFNSTPKNRFKIVPVQENKISSRFKVTPVIVSSPEEEEIGGKFANVRSSVSSNDSMDSLMAHPDLLDSESE